MEGRGDVYINGQRLRDLRDDRVLTQESFAHQLGVSRNWVYGAERSSRKRVLRSKLVQIAKVLNISPNDLLANDQTSNVSSEQHYAPIPTFDLPLSAARWSLIEGAQDVTDPRSFDQGLLRVRIIGRCMEPVYSSGRLIEFLIVRRDQVKAGMDVYVQKIDGHATFKRVIRVEAAKLVIGPINPEFTDRLTVLWTDVSRVATAEHFVDPVRE